MRENNFRPILKELCTNKRLMDFVEEGDWVNLLGDVNYNICCEVLWLSTGKLVNYLINECELDPRQSKNYCAMIPTKNMTSYTAIGDGTLYFDDITSSVVEDNNQFEIVALSAEDLIKFYKDRGFTLDPDDIIEDEIDDDDALVQIRPEHLESSVSLYILI